MQRRLWASFFLSLAAGTFLTLNFVYADDDDETKSEEATTTQALQAIGVLQVQTEAQPAPQTKAPRVIQFKSRKTETAEPQDQVFEIVVGEEDAVQALPAIPGVPAVPVPGKAVPAVPGFRYHAVPAVPPTGAAVPYPVPGDFAARGRYVIAQRYFLGVQMGELTDTLKSQLNLENGIVVAAVIPESPAAKGGVKQHDILVQVGEKKLSQPEDLLAYVEESKGKEVTLKILRGGKDASANITPGDRPAHFNIAVPPPVEVAKAQRIYVRPGIVLKTPAELPELPGNLLVKINKEGEGRAKVIITHDGKTFEGTTDKLDAIPENIRPIIERMLGAHGTGTVDLDVLVNRGEPGVRLEVQAKDIDETLDKWLPGAQALLKEAAEHKQQGEMLQEALRRAMVFAQRHQADVVRSVKPAEASDEKVEDKLNAVLEKLEQVQNRLKELEESLPKKSSPRER